MLKVTVVKFGMRVLACEFLPHAKFCKNRVRGKFIPKITILATVTPVSSHFYRAMRCKHGLCCHAVSVCLSVCSSVRPSVTFVDHVKTNKDIFKNFSPLGSDTILVFPSQRGCRYSDGNPPNGGVECKGGMIK